MKTSNTPEVSEVYDIFKTQCTPELLLVCAQSLQLSMVIDALVFNWLCEQEAMLMTFIFNVINLFTNRDT